MALESLIIKVVLGLVVGFITGFLIKVLWKFLIFLIAAYGSSIYYLNYRNYIDIHWNKIYTVLTTADLPFASYISSLSSIGIIALSFLVGFYIGTQINARFFAGISFDD